MFGCTGPSLLHTCFLCVWCMGFSCCRLRLWSAGATAVLTGSVAPWHVGSSQARDQTHVPCPGRQSLNEWTPRDVLGHLIFLSSKSKHQVVQSA